MDIVLTGSTFFSGATYITAFDDAQRASFWDSLASLVDFLSVSVFQMLDSFLHIPGLALATVSVLSIFLFLFLFFRGLPFRRP